MKSYLYKNRLPFSNMAANYKVTIETPVYYGVLDSTYNFKTFSVLKFGWYLI